MFEQHAWSASLLAHYLIKCPPHHLLQITKSHTTPTGNIWQPCPSNLKCILQPHIWPTCLDGYLLSSLFDKVPTTSFASHGKPKVTQVCLAVVHYCRQLCCLECASQSSQFFYDSLKCLPHTLHSTIKEYSATD